jgi:hypothetical protein
MGLAASQIAEWKLTVGSGDGPCIPGVAAVLLALKADQLQPGARAAVEERDLGVEEFEHALTSWLDVQITRSSAPRLSLVEQHVKTGPFRVLPQAIMESHRTFDRLYFQGRANVTRGTGLISNLIAAVFSFPPSSRDIPVTVRKQKDLASGEDGKETWLRTFGDSPDFKSVLSIEKQANGEVHLYEEFFPMKFRLHLQPTEEGKLQFQLMTGSFFGILPLPNFMLVDVDAYEEVIEDSTSEFKFKVELNLPFRLGLLVHYEGTLRLVD